MSRFLHIRRHTQTQHTHTHTHSYSVLDYPRTSTIQVTQTQISAEIKVLNLVLIHTHTHAHTRRHTRTHNICQLPSRPTVRRLHCWRAPIAERCMSSLLSQGKVFLSSDRARPATKTAACIKDLGPRSSLEPGVRSAGMFSTGR